MNLVTLDDVQRCMVPHLPIYTWHKPVYQHVALTNLQRLWDPGHTRVLDVGGGTGVLAQTIKTLFGLQHVASVDVHDRFLPSLSIETAVYDGVNAAICGRLVSTPPLLFNVLHHVPVALTA